MSEREPEVTRIAGTHALPSPAVQPGLDLTSCDREPIHVPGSIQPHGFLLVLDATGRVAVASSTAALYLRMPIAGVIGRTLPELLGEELGTRVLRELQAEPLTSAARLLAGVTLWLHEDPQSFEVVAHQAAGAGPATILEFERLQEAVDIEAINARLYNFVAAIRRLQHTDEICHAAVEEIRALTGCDRVVLYHFNEQGHGVVLAEQLAHDRFASYLGLRFPASDVPVQARRMYLVNRVRIIPDVDYEPSPLLSLDGAAPEIDLSGSVLRSVSPIHRQYMRNMGTICSMSVSIIIEGALWGLVSCHHHAPRYVPLRLRSACDFIMQIVASQIESQSNSARLQRALQAKEIQSKLLASMAGQDNYMAGLAGTPEMLLDLVGADGAAIVAGEGVTLLGIAPKESDVQQLSEWFRTCPQDELFASSNLSAEYPAAAGFSSQGSGVIAIAVSKIHNTQVLWFRQELVQTVRWAGNPEKPAEQPAIARNQSKDAAEPVAVRTDPMPGGSPGASLPAGIVHPRHSFEDWLQIVRNSCCSEPWTDQDLQAASEFRSGVIEIVLRRAEEMAELATGLQVANEELEAFSYSVSHDLRAPFRHISGFSEMLREEEGERMSDRGRHYLSTIMESARFAGLLVDSLLDFSRFARAKITMVPLDMEELVDREWQAVLYDEAGKREIEFSRGPLPRVSGDAQLLRQVLRNLFSNAVKYSGRRADAKIRVEANTGGEQYVFSIADNGVGFDQQYAGKLFGVFQRLHRIEDFEGTGIGLANVRRIVGRHGGRVWAEGEVGQGATFYFSMPKLFLLEDR